VDHAVLLGVLEHRLRADVAAGNVGRGREAAAVEGWRWHI
jgi:hypothetical protein